MILRNRWVAEAGLFLGTAPWLYMMFAPVGRGRRVNLVPLADLVDQLEASPGTIVVQVGGNLLAFAALGFFLPVRWAWFARPVRVLAVGAALSVAVEILQYLEDVGRYSSVDDVLLNATGALLAGLCSRRWWRQSRTSTASPSASSPVPSGIR